MSNEYQNKLVEGLNPLANMTKIGHIYRDTLQGLSEKVMELITSDYGIPELDNIMIIPKLSNNNPAGASELVATAYFSTSDGNGNIFYRGKGHNRNNNGRISMVGNINTGGNTGPFAVSDHFRQVFNPLCNVNTVNGRDKVAMTFKTVPGCNRTASLDLNANAVIALALGITPTDNYEFMIMNISPISNTTNFSVVLAKYIMSSGVRKGKNSSINYAKLEQEQFNRVNNRGTKGGRTY